jgi:hypothetical protein
MILIKNLYPLLKNKQHKYSIERGLFFGYPQCCILEFCMNFHKSDKRKNIFPILNLSDLSKEQIKLIDFIGYMPCNRCSKSMINTNRTLDSNIKFYRKSKYLYFVNKFDYV